MSWASSEAVGVLTFLLPGFLAAAIFYSLTSHPVPGAFDRVVHALIFTMVGQALTALLFLAGGNGESPGWNNSHDLIVSIGIAVALALISVYITNNDTLHSVLRRIGLTKETSYPSEWYSTFARHPDCYVILHMDGQRRLYGWPAEWPGDPNEGYFCIIEAEWLTDNVADANGLVGTDVSAILVSAGQVEMVEFLNAETAENLQE